MEPTIPAFNSCFKMLIQENIDKLTPCIMCVQYRGGVQYRGDIMSTVGVVQYRGGYLEYRGGIQYRGGDIMSTVGVILSTVGDIQYRGEIS